MITEDYVSFETAKLLKEKGFNEPCASYAINGDKLMRQWNLTKENYYPRCTIQMAMKWLREVHFLFIDIDPLTGYKWLWSIWLMNDPTQKMGESLEIFSTYKEVCEDAIKYCLENLI